jgi:hypothetical protein
MAVIPVDDFSHEPEVWEALPLSSRLTNFRKSAGRTSEASKR